MIEKAVIKLGNKIAGFIISDGSITKPMNVKQVKELAAQNKISTLTLVDDKLKPRYGDEELSLFSQFGDIGSMSKDSFEQMKNRVMHISNNMTLSDYVKYDIQFRKEDIDFALDNDNAIAGTIGIAIKTGCAIRLLTELYAPHDKAYNIMQATLNNCISSGILRAQDVIQQGKYMSISSIIVEGQTNFIDALKQNGIKLKFNVNSLNSIEDRLLWTINKLGINMSPLMIQIIKLLPDDISYLHKLIK